jgi:hypothetical protein
MESSVYLAKFRVIPKKQTAILMQGETWPKGGGFKNDLLIHCHLSHVILPWRGQEMWHFCVIVFARAPYTFETPAKPFVISRPRKMGFSS